MMSGTKFKDAQGCGISATQRCSSPVMEAAIWSEVGICSHAWLCWWLVLTSDVTG
jgi:hypothetical protein